MGSHQDMHRSGHDPPWYPEKSTCVKAIMFLGGRCCYSSASFGSILPISRPMDQAPGLSNSQTTSCQPQLSPAVQLGLTAQEAWRSCPELRLEYGPYATPEVQYSLLPRTQYL